MKRRILLILLLLFIPNVCFAYEEKKIHVSNTEEALKVIDGIYSTYDIDYYAITFDEGNVDVDKVLDYYKKNYMTDININTYRYEDYAYYQPERFLPIVNGVSISVNNMNRKITSEEIKKLDEFTDKFIHLFDGKSDYEKIYMAYSYISNNAIYQNTGSFEKLVDGYTSAYDVLIDHKTVCIGSSTAFSYLMDKLGIESFIVDHIGYYDEATGTYSSTHTFNVVKLDQKYYIVDIKYGNDLSGLLISNKDYKNEKFNFDIVVSDEDYPRSDFTYSFDENEINKELEDVKNNDNLKIDESIYYIVLVLILVVISLVIFIFTRKKNK